MILTRVKGPLVYPGLPHVAAVRQEADLGVGVSRAAEVPGL